MYLTRGKYCTVLLLIDIYKSLAKFSFLVVSASGLIYTS
jgi:hypothetical protein